MFCKLLLSSPIPTWGLFAEFAVAALIVIVAGARFAKLADELATRLGIGGGWIGLILLATVTSLPELVTSGTATWLGNVDLALGGLFGSCSFNITILVLLNALIGGGSVLKRVSPAHNLSSSFGLALIVLGLLGIVVADKFSGQPAIAQACEIGWALGIFVAYVGCMRLVHRFELAQVSGEKTESTTSPISKPSSLVPKLVVITSVIVAASWWLANLGDVLSTHKIALIGRPLGATFVGALFIALSTSLPEIATSISAVRLGNLNMALGNIFGSNMFNIFVIPFLKLISWARGDAFLIAGSRVNNESIIITGLIAILLTAIAIGGLTYKSRRTMLRRFGFDSILIALTYCGGMWLLLAGGE